MAILKAIPLAILLACTPVHGQDDGSLEEQVAALTVEILDQSATLSALQATQRSLVIGIAHIYGANATRVLVLGAQWRTLKAHEQEFEQAITKAQTESEKRVLRNSHRLVETTIKAYFDELLKATDAMSRLKP